MDISIIGYGFVGKSIKKIFKDAIVYDPQAGHSLKREEAYRADIMFICVPTPNLSDGNLDYSIVEDIVKLSNSKLICIRSTLSPGTTDKLSLKYGKRIVFQPEYLGETPNHPMSDQYNRKFIILGGKSEDTRTMINAYSSVYNANIHIRQVTAIEAEVIKLTANRATAFKVAECHELYELCEKAGVDYYTIREGVYGDDPRMSLWWTFVYPNSQGLNSKCLPKDLIGWCAWAESIGYTPKVSQAIINKNIDWTSKKEL